MDSAAKIGYSVQQAAINSGLAELDFTTATSIVGLSLHEAGRRLFPTASEQQVLSFAEHYRQQFRQSTHIETPLFAGALELLQQLHQRGHLLAVATGKSRAGLDRMLPVSYTHLTLPTKA